jgi:hypothetical protein
MTSGAIVTFCGMSSASLSAAGRRLSLGSGLPFGRLDPVVVPDVAVFVQGDVEVDPQEDQLALDVQVGEEVHGRVTC